MVPPIPWASGGKAEVWHWPTAPRTITHTEHHSLQHKHQCPNSFPALSHVSAETEGQRNLRHANVHLASWNNITACWNRPIWTQFAFMPMIWTHVCTFIVLEIGSRADALCSSLGEQWFRTGPICCCASISIKRVFKWYKCFSSTDVSLGNVRSLLLFPRSTVVCSLNVSNVGWDGKMPRSNKHWTFTQEVDICVPFETEPMWTYFTIVLCNLCSQWKGYLT